MGPFEEMLDLLDKLELQLMQLEDVSEDFMVGILTVRKGNKE